MRMENLTFSNISEEEAREDYTDLVKRSCNIEELLRAINKIPEIKTSSGEIFNKKDLKGLIQSSVESNKGGGVMKENLFPRMFGIRETVMKLQYINLVKSAETIDELLEIILIKLPEIKNSKGEIVEKEELIELIKTAEEVKKKGAYLNPVMFTRTYGIRNKVMELLRGNKK
ncbi:hypothetical protein KKA39_00300 [Patescibacteria group bacterium]|nr:hypothetical protein [Patescibacteria group bacterium]MBU1727750.1 hypothetical protein [Patescibacteria group bacterium]